MSRRIMLALLCAIVPSAASAQQAATPCSAPEASQFNFWIGEWDITWQGGSGTNIITSEMGGCVIEENFSGIMAEGRPPYLGNSHSVWSPAKGKWQQTWVDNQGGYLVFEGGIEGDTMVLYGTGRTPDGSPTRTRMTFADITDDSITWHWDRSIDDGATWTSAWLIQYRRKGSDH